jgi:D-serine dehydratase
MENRVENCIKNVPEVFEATQMKETFWLNANKKNVNEIKTLPVSLEKIKDATKRLERFASYLQIAFPETKETSGIVESPLREIKNMQTVLKEHYNARISGQLFLKMDSHLPISGSVKARGGIYEILKYAETLAIENGMLNITDDYVVIASDRFKEFYSKYTIQVGSTGNLGLSIGIVSAKLGFRVIVHMSADAKQWKKDLLRQRGVTVIEYESDYCAAVEQGRKESDADNTSYFVDDENSLDLFLGYSVAGERLEHQLKEKNIVIDAKHPMFVYLPCGIGGAPGGVLYGLKQIFGDNVHGFFTEPTHACCMLLGCASGLHDEVSVKDFGIDGKTEADGLAVGRASAFIGRTIEPYLSGIATIQDENLYLLMRDLLEMEDVFIEPSACASFAAFLQSKKLEQYIVENGLQDVKDNIVHIAWATGGNMVPKYMVDEYLEKAKLVRLNTQKSMI